MAAAPRLRLARPEDLEAICAIYNHEVAHATSTFDTEPWSAGAKTEWLAARSPDSHPVLVAEHGDEVVGWVSVARWSPKRGYDRTAEVSVFVAAGARRRGVGRALLAEALSRAERAGHRCLLGRIEAANGASLRLFAEAGFVTVGTMHEVGEKFGRRLDIVVVEKLLEAAPAVQWPDHARLPLFFDAERMSREADAFAASDWVEHFVPDNYEGAWSALPLRCAEGASHPVQRIHPDPAAVHFVDTELLVRAPYLREVLAQLPCPVLSARLMRLGAGSRILEHRDHDLAAELGRARLHVPVRTHAGVRFLLNGRRLVMAPGECWYLRLADPHRVENEGPVDRVHLVVDVVVDAWLRTAILD